MMSQGRVMRAFFATFMFCQTLAFAQDPGGSTGRLVPPILPMAPNAASLARFGDIPVSNYTGTPEIDIPIYTIREGPLSVPISVSYHASGIRVEDRASWVGLGWSLNAGGSLSRTMRGMFDETSNGFLTQGYKIDDEPSLDNASYLKQASEGLIDTSSDIYFLNAPGISTKFSFSYNREILQTDYKDILIEYPFFTSNQQWHVVAADGTHYYFGQNTGALTGGKDISSNTIDAVSGNTVTYVSAWHLEKIISSDKQDTIKFYYNNESISYVNYSPESIAMPFVDYNNPNIVPQCFGAPTYTARQELDASISQALLNKIEFRNGYVEFVASSSTRTDVSGSHSLERINIKDKAGNLIKYFKFKHGKFAGSRADLKLNEVKEYSPDGDSLSPHSFSYNESVVLEPQSSYKQDHWGFFNNNPTQKLIPQVLNDASGLYVFYDDGGSRETDATRTLASILNKITYPTGGRTEFEFEANDISMVGNRPATEYYTIDSSANASCISGQCETTGELTDESTFHLDQATVIRLDMHSTCVRPGSPGMPSTEPIGGGVVLKRLPNTDIIGSSCGNAPNDQVQSSRYMVLNAGDYKMTASANRSGSSFSTAHITVSISARRTVTLPGSALVGGARIKAMREYDTDNSLLGTRKYNYTVQQTPTSPIESSGVLISKPTYHYLTHYATMLPIGGNEFGPIYAEAVCQDNNGISTPRNSPGDGTHIGYKQVKVSYGETGENGSTVYKYTAADQQPDVGGTSFPFGPPESRDNRRGKMTDQIDFNSNGDTIKYVKYSYKIDTNKKKFGSNLTVGKWLTSRLSDWLVEDFRISDYTSAQEWQYLDKQTETLYSAGGRVKTETSFFYERPDNHVQLTRTETSTSDGSVLRNTFKYPQDYSANIELANITALRSQHIFTPVIESQSWLVKSTGASLLSSQIADFNTQFYKPSDIWLSEIANNIQSLNNESITNSKYDHLLSDTRFFNKRATFDYDNGRVKLQANTNDVKKSYLWGYRNSQPIAEVVNAGTPDIAYTSFEDNSDGGWTMFGSKVTNSFTGKRAYLVASGQSVTHSGLSNSKQYEVVFWAYMGANILVNGQAASTSLSSGSWTKCEAVVSSSTSVTVSGSGTIDELRICPLDAQMKTLTYDPFFGATTIADENGVPTFYVYDKFGRLRMVTDYQGNILKTHEYHYRDR
jgi:YD repeat-containing protein